MASNILDFAPILIGTPSGIVRWLRIHRRWLQDPDLFFVSAELVDVSKLGGAKYDNRVIVGGAGTVVDEAVASCLGEAVERYSAAFVPRGQIVIASEEGLKKNSQAVLSPMRFLQFNDEQYSKPAFRISRYIPKQKISWIMGWNPFKQKHVLIPASVVFFPFVARTPGDKFAPQITSGLAAGTSPEAAGAVAFCELVERDSLALMWHGKVSVPLVEFNSNLPKQLKDVLCRSEKSGAKIHLFDITTNIRIPTYFAVSTANPPLPAVTVGCAASLDALRAAHKAILEASFTRALAMRQMRVNSVRPNDQKLKASSISNFGVRALWYANPENTSAFDFLLKTTSRTTLKRWKQPKIQANRQAEEFWEIVNRLEAKHISSYIIDLTTPDMAELGLFTVRAISGNLQPLEGHSKLVQTVKDRIKTAYTGQKLRMSSMEEFGNKFPHPLP